MDPLAAQRVLLAEAVSPLHFSRGHVNHPALSRLFSERRRGRPRAPGCPPAPGPGNSPRGSRCKPSPASSPAQLEATASQRVTWSKVHGTRLSRYHLLLF